MPLEIDRRGRSCCSAGERLSSRPSSDRRPNGRTRSRPLLWATRRPAALTGQQAARRRPRLPARDRSSDTTATPSPEAPSRSGRGARPRSTGSRPRRATTRTTSRPRWSRRSRTRAIQVRHERPGLSDCDTLASSSASRRTSRASASTTPRRWPSCCASIGHPGPDRRGLPAGRRIDRATGVEQVRNSDAHAWVEVYFPGYGWVDVRPDRRQPSRRCRPLPSGSRRSASAKPRSVGRRHPPAAPTIRPRRGAGRPASGGGINGRATSGRPAHRRRASCCRHRRRPRLRRLAARPARRRRPPDGAYGIGHAARRRASGSGRGRTRPSTSTPAPSARSCRRRAGARDRRPGQGRGRLRRPRLGRRPDSRALRDGAATAAGQPAAAGLPPRATGARRRALRRAVRLERAAAGCAPPRRLASAASSRSGARCAVRLWARRTGRPARNSTTRDRAQVHRPHPEPLERQVEQRQQGDLEDAVVADDDRPRVVGPAVAVAGDLRPVERARRAGRRRARARIVGERRPDPRLRPRGATRRRAPRPRAGVAARPASVGRVAGRRSRRGGGPPTRPGRSRGSPGRAGGDGAAAGSRPARRRSPRRSAVVRRERRVDDLERRAGRDRQRRRGVRVRRAGRRRSAAWRRPDRRSAASRPGPGSGPRR